MAHLQYRHVQAVAIQQFRLRFFQNGLGQHRRSGVAAHTLPQALPGFVMDILLSDQTQSAGPFWSSAGWFNDLAVDNLQQP